MPQVSNPSNPFGFGGTKHPEILRERALHQLRENVTAGGITYVPVVCPWANRHARELRSLGGYHERNADCWRIPHDRLREANVILYPTPIDESEVV